MTGSTGLGQAGHTLIIVVFVVNGKQKEQPVQVHSNGSVEGRNATECGNKKCVGLMWPQDKQPGTPKSIRVSERRMGGWEDEMPRQTLIRSDNHGVLPKGMNCNFLFRGINCRSLSLGRLALLLRCFAIFLYLFFGLFESVEFVVFSFCTETHGLYIVGWYLCVIFIHLKHCAFVLLLPVVCRFGFHSWTRSLQDVFFTLGYPLMSGLLRECH